MQESGNSVNQEPKPYTLLLVGYWLRPEEFGFVCSLMLRLGTNDIIGCFINEAETLFYLTLQGNEVDEELLCLT